VSTHLFFLYVPELASCKNLAAGTSLSLPLPDLARRIYTILRLKNGEEIELFCKDFILAVRVENSPRPDKTFACTITRFKPTAARQSQLTAAIGLTKKESFEEVVHHATVAGATHILPVVTAKSRHCFLNEREAERLTAILIAACEQSKNHQLPQLLKPAPLAAVLKQTTHSLRIGFEAGHAPFTSLLAALTAAPDKNVSLFIGPEGGFTEEECAQLTESGCLFYALTPTILRTQEATCLAVGAASCILFGRK